MKIASAGLAPFVGTWQKHQERAAIDNGDHIYICGHEFTFEIQSE